MPPVRKIEIMHRVIIHPEHAPKPESEALLCNHHYLMARSCKMVVRYLGIKQGKCTICN